MTMEGSVLFQNHATPSAIIQTSTEPLEGAPNPITNPLSGNPFRPR